MKTLLVTVLLLTCSCVSVPPESAFAPTVTTATQAKSVGDPLSTKCGKCAADSDCQSGLHCDTQHGAVCREPSQYAFSCESECLDDVACIQHGMCTPTPTSGCVATSADDCQLATDCHTLGRCHLFTNDNGTSCEPTSQADCNAAQICKDAAKGCTFMPPAGCLD